MIKVLYFASLRDRLDSSGEQLDATDISDVAALKTLLSQRQGDWNAVFSQDELLLCAVNQEMAQDQTSIEDGDEIGFFPPVTGG